MKKVHSVIYLSFLIILLLVTPVNGSSDWVEYSRDNEGNVRSYNKASIKHRTKDIVQVWEKWVFSDKNREKHIQRMRNKGVTLTKEWDKVSYKLLLVEIDCKKGMFRRLSYTKYDTDGNVLDSSPPSDKTEWIYMVLGSMEDTLQKKVCK